MKLILNGVNGDYLQNITLNAACETEEVWAAVAYATSNDLLFNWCEKKNIKLTFYGRQDPQVAVNTRVLHWFLQRKSARFTCRLVEKHHAKIVWWRGYGAYIGSANLTGSAWINNVEAGCFVEEHEMDDKFRDDLISVFDKLKENSTPLTQELYDLMKQRETKIKKSEVSTEDYDAATCLNHWGGLVHINKKDAKARQYKTFIKEWNETLQVLRDLSGKVSLEGNRPDWVPNDASKGTQVDQFLHAYYYYEVCEGVKSHYEYFYDKNSPNPEKALEEALTWWRTSQLEFEYEKRMLSETAPRLKELLPKERLKTLNCDEFEEICSSVHSMREYAKRAANKNLSLPSRNKPYNIDEKTKALANCLFYDKTKSGLGVLDVLYYVFYGGPVEDVPKRLWDAKENDEYKLPNLGLSSLGEIIGWAMPDVFPPRNGRTSKALRALGYDVKIY